MRHQRLAVLRKPGDKDGNVEVGVGADTQSKVVCRCQDFDPVRKVLVALPPHVLLEGGRGGAAAVDLPVEERGQQHARAQLVHVRSHHVWRVSSGERPAHVARSVPHVRTHTVAAAPHVILDGLCDNGHGFWEAEGQQQATAGEFGESEAPTVPRPVPLARGEQLKHGCHHVVGEILGQAACDAADPFCCRPAHHCVAIPEPDKQLLHNVLELVRHPHPILVLAALVAHLLSTAAPTFLFLRVGKILQE
mmetsp:Transcript_48326/g.95789  ORF Transcript_48326/g.95789 Transcript_48326/m.95789 type:complete len:249 (-) Transcript_48326:389-1135(-)